jgi:hypothetical protein
MNPKQPFAVGLIQDIFVLAPTRWKLRRAVKAVDGRLALAGDGVIISAVGQGAADRPSEA